MKTTELFFRYLVAAITICAEYICTLFIEPQNSARKFSVRTWCTKNLTVIGNKILFVKIT